MRSFFLKFLCAGIVLLSTTELLDDLIDLGGIYLSPGRIYVFTLILMVALLTLSKRTKTWEPQVRKLFVILAIFIVIVFLSAFKSNDFLYSIKKAVFFAATYFLPFFVWKMLVLIKADEPYNIRVLLKWYVYSAVLVSLFGIQQAFTHFLLLDDETRNLLGFNVVRINSVFYDPNFLGYFLLGAFYLISPGVFAKRLHRKVFGGIILIAIFFTGSQGTLISLFTGLGILFLSRTKIKFHKMKLFLLGGLLPILFLLVALRFDEMLEFVQVNELSTMTPRLIAWYSGLTMFVDNFMLGIGPGNYVTMDKSAVLSAIVDPWQLDAYNRLAAHSNYIEIMVESGVFALFMYLLFYFTLIRWLDLRALGNPFLRRASVVLIVSMIANSVLSYHSYSLLFLTGIFIFIAERNILLERSS